MDALAPALAPHPGWTPCQPFPEAPANNSFVSGGPSGRRLRVAYYHRQPDQALVGKAWFGPETEGPPGHAHGGSIAAVLDEVLGGAAWAAGHPVVVARLSVDFRLMIPIGTDATFETSLVAVTGRKITTRGRLLDESGAVLAEGEALCVTLTAEHIDLFKGVAEPTSR